MNNFGFLYPPVDKYLVVQNLSTAFLKRRNDVADTLTFFKD